MATAMAVGSSTASSDYRSSEDQLPTVTKTLVVGYLEDTPELPGGRDGVDDGGSSIELWSTALRRHQGAELRVLPLPPGDHPLYILYSSGTTGKPKCIVHRTSGVLLKHLSEQRLHADIAAGDRVFYFTTCGWMMWNWLVSCLASGATVICYDGNPAHPDPDALFEVADRYDVTLLGVSAKYIDAVMKSGILPRDRYGFESLRTICSTGSPLSHEAFAWVYDSVATDVHLASISGGTDLCGCLVIGDPTRPVYAGEIQAKALGLAIEVFDDDGRPLGPGVKGELVCTNPFPSMPLGFWGDDDGSRYRAAYFERFDGAWAHGDYASWTEHGGMIIHGRSDATLNASGVRIGTAEIYRVVETARRGRRSDRDRATVGRRHPGRPVRPPGRRGGASPTSSSIASRPTFGRSARPATCRRWWRRSPTSPGLGRERSLSSP